MNITAEETEIISSLISKLTIVDGIILYTSLVLQLLFLIFLIYHFYQKTKTFSSAFYYILAIGYFLNIILVLFLKLSEHIKDSYFLTTIFYIIWWYDWRFYGFWNTVLAFNRFTTLFLFSKHEKIWSGWPLAAIFGAIIFYPFILNGYLLKNFQCFFVSSKSSSEYDCPEFFGSSTVPLSNSINAIVALILGLFTTFARKLKGGDPNQKKQKYETYLLIMSIVASFLLIASEGAAFASLKFNNALNEIYPSFNLFYHLGSYCLALICNWICMLFYVTPIVLLFCLSKSFRESFISFYHLYYLPGIKRSIAVRTTQITVISKSMR